MNEEQKKQVYADLSAIMAEEERHRLEMKRLRNNLLNNAKNFATYSEMYTFIRANTPSFEAFCADMREARDIFDSSHRHN